MTMSGLVDRASRTGTMTAQEAISGRRLQFTEVFSGPAADRAGAARGISTLESALESDKLPMDAWIDHSNLVRRVRIAYSECVAGQHIQFGMTMDVYDYGPQPQPRLPSSGDAYDLTPLLTSALGKIKFGCAAG